MRPLARRTALRGQAAIEAMLALALLGAFMHGVLTVGELWLRGQHAAQASRVAMFAGVQGLADDLGDHDATISVVPMQPVNHLQGGMAAGVHANRGPAERNRQGHIENSHADILAQHWLGVGLSAGLYRANATIHSARAPSTTAFTLPHANPSILSVQRYLVMATNAGHGVSETAVSRRIQDSSLGWSTAAERSTHLAEMLRHRVERLDASLERAPYSTDWLDQWADVGPRKTSASRHRNVGDQ